MTLTGMEPDPNSKVLGMHLWGWMSPAELTWLHEEARRMKNVVEIGSLVGRSSFALLAGCPGPVYCIDPWDDENGRAYGSFMTNVGRFPNLVALKGFSPAVGTLIPGDIDMVFIDGNHDYENCRADLEYWFPRTQKLICGHDYNHPGYPGVHKAVDEFFGKKARKKLKVEVLEKASIWVVRV